VRAAAIEINLVVNNLAKTDETADRIMRSAESIPSNRPWAAWELGMLANRGVEPERIHQLLVTYIHEPEPQTRFWAVEGLAHLGTDETIKDFLEVLGSDVFDGRARARRVQPGKVGHADTRATDEGGAGVDRSWR
jgi:HEAT repeat protein